MSKSKLGAYKEAWCRSSGDGHRWHTANGISSVIFSAGTMILELISGHCENTKVTCSLPGFSSRERNLWVVHPKRLDRKFSKDIFLGYLIEKNVTQNWTAKKTTFRCHVFGKVSKKHYCEIFGRAILDCGTQRSLFINISCENVEVHRQEYNFKPRPLYHTHIVRMMKIFFISMSHLTVDCIQSDWYKAN